MISGSGFLRMVVQEWDTYSCVTLRVQSPIPWLLRFVFPTITILDTRQRLLGRFIDTVRYLTLCFLDIYLSTSDLLRVLKY